MQVLSKIAVKWDTELAEHCFDWLDLGLLVPSIRTGRCASKWNHAI